MATPTPTTSTSNGDTLPGGDESPPPIVVRGLTKNYGRHAAVDRVDLTVNTGDVYGFLGPNGAGKTTTMRMLLGLVHPDGGSMRLFGNDPTADPIRALDGVAGIIEEPRLYPYLSGRANLELLAAFDRAGAGRDVIDSVLEQVELAGRGDDRVATYSQGMRQRLGIASCLVRRPRLLMLDEPANGVDPAGLRFLRKLIRDLVDHGVTVLLSSHLLAEVQAVCNRVAVIHAGRIVYEGSLADLESTAGAHYRLIASDTPRAAEVLKRLEQVSALRLADQALEFELADARHMVPLTRALADADVGIIALTQRQPTLEGLFFQLTEQNGPQTAGGSEEPS